MLLNVVLDFLLYPTMFSVIIMTVRILPCCKSKCNFVMFAHPAGMWGSEGMASLILNLGTSWRLVVGYTCRLCTTGINSTGTHSVARSVGPRAGLDVCWPYQ